ncbi:gamma carbonic anhydrase family protein [Sphingomonas sp. SUN039]|uniref:gamma carbonic anhydrase family protein n=1 Tax=Sphingomonas sp. SUN039 TaxID=2937787 RepID=UPI0021645D94|nr:gamma carbonic anhydrase family protein [Sphingomonas sp. SUN039]UVO53416.1 gamma carbonic anhydrase family protein [Sphingomonas sp. SUN039]
MDEALNTIIPFQGKTPKIDPSAFIAPGARIIGDVEIGPNSSIWYNCVLRGDVNAIRIGARTNVQDGTVIHCDSPKPGNPAGLPTIIGDDVLIGHMVMLHGSILHDRAFVGLSSTVMDGCTIESDGMLAAGALLSPGKIIRAGELWIGRPAKMLRILSAEEIAANQLGAAHYAHLAALHAEAVSG